MKRVVLSGGSALLLACIVVAICWVRNAPIPGEQYHIIGALPDVAQVGVYRFDTSVLPRALDPASIVFAIRLNSTDASCLSDIGRADLIIEQQDAVYLQKECGLLKCNWFGPQVGAVLQCGIESTQRPLGTWNVQFRWVNNDGTVYPSGELYLVYPMDHRVALGP